MGADDGGCRRCGGTQRSRHQRGGRRAIEHGGDQCLRGWAWDAADDPRRWKLRGGRNAGQLERPGDSAGGGGRDGAQGPAGPRGRTGRIGKQGKIKLKLSGDLGTQLILGRLKAINKKVVDIQDKVQDTKETALYLKGYLKVHHQNGATCKDVENVYQLIQVIQAGDSGVLPLGLGCN